jgi:ABC-type transporter Mla maintaining outer membrane lipid asymmetry ATPase subunit MlaF
MGFLFQGGALFDSLSIEDNITFYTSNEYGFIKLVIEIELIY